MNDKFSDKEWSDWTKAAWTRCKELGLSRAELGRRVGLSRQAVSAYLNSDDPRRPSPTIRRQVDSVLENKLGNYEQDDVRYLLGLFVAYRTQLHPHRPAVRAVFDISWDDEQSGLSFKEYNRRPNEETPGVYDHTGVVSIAPSRNGDVITFLTHVDGAVRTHALVRGQEPVLLTGVLSTTRIMLTGERRPASAYVVMMRAQDELCTLHKTVGELKVGDERYTDVINWLRQAEELFETPGVSAS